MTMTKKEWLLEEFDCSYHALYDRVAPLMRLKFFSPAGTPEIVVRMNLGNVWTANPFLPGV
jgi:hypothetical protein